MAKKSPEELLDGPKSDNVKFESDVTNEEKREYHSESSTEKRVRLQTELVNRQTEAKAGRLEGDIDPNDDYWKVKQDIQQKMHKLDATPDNEL
jgi:hypothetical protein